MMPDVIAMITPAWDAYNDWVTQLMTPVWQAETDAIVNGLHFTGQHQLADQYDNGRWWLDK
ncbi:hypothetical protein [Corynebacterium variabile]|uniref:hypothetical protein n=1 Tax=Corynebacterium variabile TaxID=1727 RepID=UPI003BB1F996